MTVIVRMGQMNIELRSGDPAAINAIQAQFVTFDAELGQFGFQKFEIQPAIQQRADEHIAAGTRKTVQIQSSCHV